jgi:hypothetical protein
MKLDISNAFNSVNWPYLLNIMSYLVLDIGSLIGSPIGGVQSPPATYSMVILAKEFCIVGGETGGPPLPHAVPPGYGASS